MSRDGYITAPGDDVDNPLGAGGQCLHEWMYGLASWREHHGREGGKTNADADIIETPSATVSFCSRMAGVERHARRLGHLPLS